MATHASIRAWVYTHTGTQCQGQRKLLKVEVSVLLLSPASLLRLIRELDVNRYQLPIILSRRLENGLGVVSGKHPLHPHVPLQKVALSALEDNEHFEHYARLRAHKFRHSPYSQTTQQPEKTDLTFTEQTKHFKKRDITHVRLFCNRAQNRETKSS